MLKFFFNMKQTLSDEIIAKFFSVLEGKSIIQAENLMARNPVHVVYGGANLFKAETPAKLGRLALNSIEHYAPNFVEFADAMWLKGAETLPKYETAIQDLEFRLSDNPDKVKLENFDAWFARTIYQRTIDKLKLEPIEDFRIDFEDGYGIRTDEEEDSHCISASEQLAVSCQQLTVKTPFCGFRIKSFQPETRKRAVRTLDLFLSNLLENTNGKLPENFVVTLPKVKFKEEVKILDQLLSEFEKQNGLEIGEIKIEIMIETPESILNLQDFVLASNNRCIAAHFGAYDFTSGFGIAANHQHLGHEACNFARNMMQVSLSPLGIRLSDSVTTEMPVPIHRVENLSDKQLNENKRAVHKGWRKHFTNITHSLINGFYQSWDLHPAQLVARYAAVYAFFYEAKDEQAMRLRGFLKKATQALLTGNQFDDMASAQGLLNFFIRALNCGALSESEILETTSLTLEELSSASFDQIMNGRKMKSVSKN
jgi:hypothetical protein